MNYYFWIKGYEKAGVVKASSIEEGKHKVIMSQGECSDISALDVGDYDGYDVTTLLIF